MSGFLRKKIFRYAIAAVFLMVFSWSVANAMDADNNVLNSVDPLSDENAPQSGHGLTPQELGGLIASGKTEKAFSDGSVLTLSIDKDLQSEVFNLFRRYDPPYGAFVAMEPSTGRVLAMVGYQQGGKSDPWLALKAIYPAASLIKIVTAAAAVELGNVSPYDEIRYRGGIYKINRSGIHSDEGGSSMTFEEAIARSANSVFGKVTVRDVGAPALGVYLEKFGFGMPIPFDMTVEPSSAEVPSDEYELARTGAGFGDVYVSPLHMAMVMSALASDGPMPRPLLVDRIVDGNGYVDYESVPSKLKDTVLPDTAQAVVRMMVKTIEMGTSRRAFGTPDRTPLLQDMEVAGKTGSLSGWTPPMHFEWFAGLAPVDAPRLALAALVVNDHHGKIKGSYVGKEAFSAYFGYPSSDPPSYYARSKRKGVRNISKASNKKIAKQGKAKKRRLRKDNTQ
ncbi:MAG: penicillin-binding transpeptidase domain-containing protein [Syntrophorhabdaceae bacterium]|nr:penicillin-binding transpeptidase domain-containing protein [Syntrophorhabdaceae bacterium]